MKKKTYKQLIKEWDKFYSIWLRRSLADKGEMLECYTCGVKKHWKELQCGHYISRRILSTRFMEKNTKPQCVSCNLFKEGNKPQFALKLMKEYGRGILEELDSLSHITIKYSTDKIQDMIEKCKKQIKKL